jgi:hypothetical protein
MYLKPDTSTPAGNCFWWQSENNACTTKITRDVSLSQRIFGTGISFCLSGLRKLAKLGVFWGIQSWLRLFCFFVCLFCVARAIFQLSGDCHYYRWQGCKFRPMLSAYGIQQWRFCYMPHLLRHGTSVFKVIHVSSITALAGWVNWVHFLCKWGQGAQPIRRGPSLGGSISRTLSALFMQMRSWAFRRRRAFRRRWVVCEGADRWTPGWRPSMDEWGLAVSLRVRARLIASPH